MEVQTFGEEVPEGFKMDPELKAKWLDALRSGNYKQVRGQLALGGGFCCLGVLNEIGGFGCRADAGLLWDLKSDPDLCQCPLLAIPGETQRHLAFKNDLLEWSFEQIADWIEENL